MIGVIAEWKNNMDYAIKLTNIYKHFDESRGRFEVLHNINVDLAKGEFFVLLGPSGSGKSTILRIMSGLEKNYQGEVKFNQDITKRDIGFVFQQFALWPWLSVYENVSIGLVAHHVPKKECHQTVMRELELFGLDKFAHSRPRELSGGMRQRVGIARALATSPKIMFLDEPFSELDSFTAEELRKDLLKIWQERKITIIMVTHLIPEAIELADRIAVLTARPGKIEKVIENNLARPRQFRSQDFFELEDTLYKLIKP